MEDPVLHGADAGKGAGQGLSLPPPAADAAAFILANTRLLPVPLAAEIRLHLASEALDLWQRTEEELGAMGLPPPFWAFAWAGGQALARYVLDHAAIFAGRRVLDLGSGSGLTAIAAAKAGAADVLAADIDPFAVAAIALNAAANGVELEISGADLLASDRAASDIVLVGDLFYEKPLADRVLAFLGRQRQAGALVLVGDPGRSYLPRQSLERIADYSVPVSRELEDMEIKNTAVWQLK
ncbi:MAG: methyltransferase [Rhodobiaceae bacterium]|nr:methyltransferase [Rhodobiaceae bacterium]